MYQYYNRQPRTVKTVTTRQYEYNEEGRVIKEVITVEETRYEDGQWGKPYVINKTTIDIDPPYQARF